MCESREFEGTFNVHIDAPAAEVFAFLSDVTNASQWRERMEVSWIEPGQTFAVVSSFGPWRRVKMRGVVTASEPHRRFAYRITDGPLNARSEYLLEPDGDGTALRMSRDSGGIATSVWSLPRD